MTVQFLYKGQQELLDIKLEAYQKLMTLILNEKTPDKALEFSTQLHNQAITAQHFVAYEFASKQTFEHDVTEEAGACDYSDQLL